MQNIFDVHNHVLYNVDDGAQTLEESLEMIGEGYKQGVRGMILTPHFCYGRQKADIETMREHFEVLKEKSAEMYPHMKLYLGQEIMATEGMVEWLNEGKVMTMADSRYVLVEFTPDVSYPVMERYVQNLRVTGYSPIIAHCERYACLRGWFNKPNIEKIKHIVEMGSYMQVNARSVYGDEKKFVDILMERDLLHLIGTDAHSSKKRRINMEKCVDFLQKKYNDEYIRLLLAENPQKIIDNQYI